MHDYNDKKDMAKKKNKEKTKMNLKGIVRSAAAAAVSFCMCLSIAGQAAAFVDPAVKAGIINENGELNTAYVYGSNASVLQGTTFTIPVSSVTIPYDGTYQITPKFISAEDNYISYSCSDTNIATVSESGLITAVNSGNAVITCTASDNTSVEIKVKIAKKGEENFATQIFFKEDSKLLEVGEEWRAAAMVGPRGAKYTVKYHSDNKEVATVAKTGTVTAHAPGKCTITIVTNNGLSDTMEIEVADPMASKENDEENITEELPSERIEFKKDTVTVEVGEKVKPGVKFYPEGAEYDVKYKSADRSIARVSIYGTILGVSDGYTEITVSSGDMYDVIGVYVGEAAADAPDVLEYDENGNLVPSRIEFTHESDSVKSGNIISTSVNVYPPEAVYTLTYSSSNPSVAKVSSKGRIKGYSEGSSVITVTSQNGKTDSFVVTVYNKRLGGIDVSKWNGDMDWETVSNNPDINFVMIRASYGYEDRDIRLEQNVAGCEEYNIPYGFYHYLYSDTVEDAEKEADFFLDAIKDYNPTYPVVLDIEESFYQKMDKELVTDIVCAFMEKLENAGYYAMLYSYASFFDDNLNIERIKVYDFWVACWGDEERLNDNFSYSYGIWQYSETGRIDGCEEDVDLNYAYKDYPSIIKKHGLNGFEKPEAEDGSVELTE